MNADSQKKCASLPYGRDYLVNHLGLTPREKEVILLISFGFPNQKIARELSIAERTVENHVSNINMKLATCNRNQIIAYLLDLSLYLLNES